MKRPLREVLTEFLGAVRGAGVPVSVSESIDALRAASQMPADRETLREVLAATVVKDEVDRAAFDDAFERFFAGGEESHARRRRRAAGGEASPGRSRGEPGDVVVAPQRRSPEPDRERPGRREAPRERQALEYRRRRRALLRKPFRELDPLEAEELSALAEELSRRFRARLRRRLRRGRRGRLDFRRTLRRSVSHGGAAFDLQFRRRRPGRVDLLALCDVSGSVRHATELFAALLAPSADFFRRVRLFVFVDRLVEADLGDGRIVPHGPVDFHAFSDFGRVLLDLEEAGIGVGKNTVVLVLGDARNNRRPHRADQLARLRSRTRAVWWLNPEVRARWNTGDSVIDAYARHCDVVLECATASELVQALARLTR